MLKYEILFEMQKKKEKNTENVVQKCEKLKIVEQCCKQNVLYVIVKNQYLWKSKKQKKYEVFYVVEHHWIRCHW